MALILHDLRYKNPGNYDCMVSAMSWRTIISTWDVRHNRCSPSSMNKSCSHFWTVPQPAKPFMAPSSVSEHEPADYGVDDMLYAEQSCFINLVPWFQGVREL